jgi:hypothetical protein
VRVGLVWRGDPAEPAPAPESTRFRLIFEEFARRGVHAEPVVYADEVADAIRERLLGMDGVLVWVDPIVRGQDRSVLDALLRDVAGHGVFVSADPEVIQEMGTKEVLHRTRHLPWGTDTHVYRTLDELREQLPRLLRSSGPRVLKQDRGSGGNGVWKLELISEAEPGADAIVRVQPAQRDAAVHEMRLGEFVEQRRPYLQYFDGGGCFVDQPYAERLGEGMIRCYLSHERVVGFGHQYVTALMPPPPGQDRPSDPPPRLYYGPTKPEFQRLKTLLEGGWIAEMRQILGIDRESLPVIWDADFLLGPRTTSGEDTYALCEINVSGVFPIPDESVAPLVDAAVKRMLGVFDPL